MNSKVLLWKIRLPLAAALIGLAVVVITHGLITPPATEEVLVATSPIAVGDQLNATNTAMRRIPTSALPTQTLTASDLQGKPQATTVLLVGQIITPGMLSTRLTEGLPGNYSAVTIPVNDAALTLTKPGQHIDIFSIPYECADQLCHAEKVATDAIVIKTHDKKDGLITTSSENFVTIAVSSEKTAGLLGAVGHQPFNVSVTDP